jgi:hypothetical protein
MLDNSSLYNAYEAEQTRKEHLRRKQEYQINKEYEEDYDERITDSSKSAARNNNN